MTRTTKILTVSLVAGASLLAIATVVGHHGGGAFARSMEHGGGWHGRGHHGWRGHGAHKAGLHRGHGPRRMLKRLKRMDADNNGEVTEVEFLQRREQKFARLDADNSSTLSAEEVVAPMLERREWRAKRRIKRMDANKDGKVTKDEMLDFARARFAERDLDGDGKISRNDMPPKKHRWGRRGHEDKSEEGRGEAQGRDRADDGDEDRAERRGKHRKWWGWRRDRTLEKVEKRVTRRFEKRDINGDGAIDVNELVARGKERVDFAKRKRMHRLDANKDGVISKDEFLKKARDRFTLWDLDDSGAITVDDLPPNLAQRWTKQ